jgi:membrane-bound lytic murein transglycosylase MltF
MGVGGHRHVEDCLFAERIRYPFGTYTLGSKRYAYIRTYRGRQRNNPKQWWYVAMPFRDHVGGAEIEHRALYSKVF